MAVIGVTSAHGSPGATTLAVALAHRLSDCTGRPTLLIEADADGGTIAVRHQLDGPAGLTALAGAARSGLTAAELERFVVELASGVPVLAAHPAAEHAHATLRTAAAPLAEVLRGELDRDVIVDLGRLRPGAPSRALAAVCTVLLVVARSEREQLVAVADRLAAYSELAPLRLVLVGDHPYSRREVQRVLQLDAVSVVVDDAAAVRADPSAAGRRRRDAWARSVTTLAATLSDTTPDAGAPDDGAPDDGAPDDGAPDDEHLDLLIGAQP